MWKKFTAGNTYRLRSRHSKIIEHSCNKRLPGIVYLRIASRRSQWMHLSVTKINTCLTAVYEFTFWMASSTWNVSDTFTIKYQLSMKTFSCKKIIDNTTSNQIFIWPISTTSIVHGAEQNVQCHLLQFDKGSSCAAGNFLHPIKVLSPPSTLINVLPAF